MKIRRTVLADFFTIIANEHQSRAKDKPSPTLKALIDGEVKTRIAIDALNKAKYDKSILQAKESMK